MHRALGLGLLLAAAALPALSADLEGALGARWRGAWVVVTAESYSDCDGGYANNQASGRRVSGKGRVRLAPGELGKVHKLSLGRARLDLLIDLEEGLLLAHRDGPFELFDEVHCRIELQFELPREVVKAGEAAAIEAAIALVVERHEDLAGAQASARWNRRERAAYPEGYEETLAEHRAWKAAEINREVQARIERAVDEAAEAARRMRGDDPAYLAGFGAGVEEMERSHFGDCPALLSASFWAAKKSPPRDRGEDRAFRDGFDDGQLLAWSLELARRLRSCFVPVG